MWCMFLYEIHPKSWIYAIVIFPDKLSVSARRRFQIIYALPRRGAEFHVVFSRLLQKSRGIVRMRFGLSISIGDEAINAGARKTIYVP